MILYQGPSVLDGEPITAIATFKTSNRKTGDLVQVWIIRSDIAPNDAVKTGADSSICGACPHRHYLGGICYVLPFQAPLSIYKAFKRGSYPIGQPGDLDGLQVRIGAYGDPAAVPAGVWHAFLKGAAGVVGYTHQLGHVNFSRHILKWCMVSADSPKQAERFRARGLNTYRVAKPGQPIAPDEKICPSETGISCAECMACDGQSGSFVIPAHGARANKLNIRVTL